MNWRSNSIKPKISRDLNSAKMHFYSKFGNCNFNWWWVMACTSSKWGKFWLWSSIWPWRSRSIIPQNNRALNQGLLHLWSTFGDHSLNGWWVIARTNSWLTDTRTHTHAGNDNTRRPKLASCKNRISWIHKAHIKNQEKQFRNSYYLCYSYAHFHIINTSKLF